MKKTPLTRRSPLKAKKPLQAKKGLARGAGPERKSRMPKRNANRSKKLYVRNFDSPEYVEAIHSLACACCSVTGWSVAAHARSRGAGGDASDLVPLCGDRIVAGQEIIGCHTLYDQHPWELPEGTRMRLRSLAKKLWVEWKRTGELAWRGEG